METCLTNNIIKPKASTVIIAKANTVTLEKVEFVSLFRFVEPTFNSKYITNTYYHCLYSIVTHLSYEIHSW